MNETGPSRGLRDAILSPGTISWMTGVAPILRVRQRP